MSKTQWSALTALSRLGLFILAFFLTVTLHGRFTSIAPTLSWTIGTVAQAQAQYDWTQIEQEVLEEHNKVRQNPRSYIPILEAYLKRMDAKGNIPNGCGPNCTLTTNEGQAAVQEAIEFLRKQPPVGPLAEATDVARVVKGHAQDTGAIGHTGSDKSSFEDRLNRAGVQYALGGENISYGAKTGEEFVIDWMVDDGIPDRGHRTNMFDPQWTEAGVGCGPNKDYGSVCVINFIRRRTEGGGGSETGETGGPTNTQFTVVNRGTTALQALQINGANVLDEPLAAGESRPVELDPEQCKTNPEVTVSFELADGFKDSFKAAPCGGTFTLKPDQWDFTAAGS